MNIQTVNLSANDVLEHLNLKLPAQCTVEAGREYKIVGDVDGAPAYEFMGATPDGSGSSVIIR